MTERWRSPVESERISERSVPSGGWGPEALCVIPFSLEDSSTKGTEGGYLLAPRVPPLPFARGPFPLQDSPRTM